MKNEDRADYVSRDNILNILSDDEVGRVSAAESAIMLLDGEEYVDLEQLSRGVQRARATAQNMGAVLPRKAVHQKTWNQIVSHLQSRPAAVVV